VVLWAFTARFAPTYGLPVALTMAGSGMLLFFGSILAHELGHALEARHRDLEVVGITLSMFGGVTEMHAEHQSARDELAVAAVGPYLSVLCAAVFGLVATFASDLLPEASAAPVADVAGLLGWINVALAIFNLIPASPLDGGRVLRAVLWATLRDRQRAVVGAARFGQLLWLAVMALAVVGYVRQPQLRFTVMLAGIVALFLFDAARREVAASRLDALYSGRTVGQLLGPLPPAIDVDHGLELLPGPDTGGAPGSQLALVRRGDELAGLLDLSQVEAMHGTDRSLRSAGDLARPLDQLPLVDVDDDLHALVDRFQGEANVVLVNDDGRTVAAVTEREAARAIGRLRDGRGDEPSAPAGMAAHS
jgi:Zn-dependent protease